MMAKDKTPIKKIGKIKPKKSVRKAGKWHRGQLSQPIINRETKEVQYCKILQRELKCICFKHDGSCNIVRQIREVY